MNIPHQLRVGLVLSGLALLAGCGSLLPKPAVPPVLYALDDVTVVVAVQPAASAPTLIISAPRAAAGFDTRHIVYQRQPHQLDYYAQSQWADTPAQMLAPMLLRALERGGAFRAVLAAPAAAAGDYRLDTELIRLQQDFAATPSRVRLTVRAVLVNTTTRRAVAAREFDVSMAAPSEDAYGGVRAANQAARALLGELALFCAQALGPASLP
ncbi:MAG: membrane integrity-associated transporter subunit PqiC [Burkholderiaceae bacterium]|nr:membrane integrity-associated transporter subunit PqiC [Burkholderiaceae bacterium]